MKKIVLANWKANISPHKAAQWLAEFKKHYQPDPAVKVVLAPSFLHLHQVQDIFTPTDNIFWAAQDISPYPPGSYTGSIPAAWLKDMAQFVLIGHRERRRYFHETVQDVANKAREAVAAGLTPILCMDRETAGPQIAAIDNADLDRLILAYTPDDAISFKTARGVAEIADAAAYFAELSGGCPVLYGGGVHAGNVAVFMSVPYLSGAMTATGSLDPQEFVSLLKNAGRAVATKG
jgi:triosephosphate isomerase